MYVCVCVVRAQVLEPVTNRAVANVTAATPEFTIKGLAAGLDYVIKVYSYNSRGSSPPYLLEGFSLKVAENRMGKNVINLLLSRIIQFRYF